MDINLKQTKLAQFLVLVLLFSINTISQTQPSTSQNLPAGTAEYEKFRAWIGRQPREVQEAPDVLARYRAKLIAEGETPAAADKQLQIVKEQGQRLETERWNRILTAENPNFNTKPNAFLVQMTKGATPGKALDVGMGQGRNALFLAQQGWEVTGFDPAEKAVAAAKAEATRLNLKLTTQVVEGEKFNWGKEQWNLIVLSYVPVREFVPKIYDSLKPGGIAVVEGYHRDATQNSSIGGSVVFDTNELLTLFSKFRILHYEDTMSESDFGRQLSQARRLVRLCVQKQ
jgi:2-polyprenyl-3-methyl-5-hydroxy-6-metoxy-1,4-benzoquinol methylase